MSDTAVCGQHKRRAKTRSRRAGSLRRFGAKALLWSLLLAIGIFHPDGARGADKQPARLVAVGDVHGDLENFRLILRTAGLINGQDHWAGGKTTLIQTGDVIDRGAKAREAMDLLMRLQEEAHKAGGQVIPLLGNHEVMNILGDLRYVSAQTYADFATKDSEKRRKEAYAQYADWYASHAKLLDVLKQHPPEPTEEAWMASHPPGFVEYRVAFSADGTYGKWIRKHHAVAELDKVIFVHGGLAPALVSMPIEQINSQITKELEGFDQIEQDLVSRKVILPFFTIQEIAVAVQAELLGEKPPVDAQYHNSMVRLLHFNDWLCMREDGPLWFRGYDQWSDEQGASQIDKVLAAYEAEHVVVAHTVQKTAHIRSRFAGKVFLIDTGMLSSYWPGGGPSALEIADDKFVAQYPKGQEVLLETKAAAAAGKGN